MQVGAQDLLPREAGVTPRADLAGTGGVVPVRLPVPWTDPVLGLDTHIVSIGARGQQLQGRNRISRAGWDPGDSVNGASEGRKHFACESFHFPESFWETGGWGPAGEMGFSKPLSQPCPHRAFGVRAGAGAGLLPIYLPPSPSPKWAETIGPAPE